MEQIISPADALPGRRDAMVIGPLHGVNGNPTQGPWPEGMAVAWFGMGCFWGVCLLYTSPSPRDVEESRMPSSA